MTKYFYILFLSVLGFVINPSESFACGSKADKTSCKMSSSKKDKTKKSCCSKTSSKKSETKSCCKKGADKTDSKDSCGGTCGDKGCSCVVVLSISFMLPTEQRIQIRNNDETGQKQKFSDIETYISSGFYSIWSPPNIG